MILSALNDYYDRLYDRGEVPPFGYSEEKISYAIVVSPDGDLVAIDDVQDTTGKRPMPSPVWVPAEMEERTSGVKPYFLWDKSSYVLGVTNKEKKRTAEHESFKVLHARVLENEADVGLRAVRLFLEQWVPESFEPPYFGDEMLDENFVFRLDGEKEFIHQRPSAMSVWRNVLNCTDAKSGQCLVSGMRDYLARVHPKIRGISGAQSSGASIVSFNDDAYLSYRGRKNDAAESSPISVTAAFGYVTALKHMLRQSRSSRQQFRVGDSTVVFWAIADTPEKAAVAEITFASMLEPPTDDAQEAAKLRSVLDAVAKGQPIQALDANLDPETQIYVLGLAPNASRLSVRFWEIGSLEMFAKRLADHYQDLRLEPRPWKSELAIRRLLYATAPSRNGKAKAEDILPQLAGEMTRAILTGGRYPRSLLANTVMRFRADGEISGLRVALCKAVLARDLRLGVKGIEEEIPMSLDRESTSPAYRLGRLFAELENVQRTALGSVNASIKDRFFGAASATPASVFPVLLRNTQHHLSRLRKDKRGLAHVMEREIGEIVDGLEARFPRSLRIEEQGRFAIGYYHQANARFAGKPTQTDNETEAEV